MRIRVNKYTLISLVGAGAILVGGVFWGFSASDPGSLEDPLVTKGYVEEKFSSLVEEIDFLTREIDRVSKESQELEQVVELMDRVDGLEKRVDDVSDISPDDFRDTFEPMLLKRGETIIAGDSTQIILRSGTARVVSSLAGGLVDATSETNGDLSGNESVPLNHLLIVPRDDGRGIRITSGDAWVMVKGPFEVKD